MKKLAILVFVAIMAVSFSSCQKEKPQSVAEKFLSAYVKADFETAKTVTSGDALEQINQISNMISSNPEFFPKDLNYENLNCQENENKVKCTFTMVQGTEKFDGNYVELEQVDGKWMVTTVGYEGEELPEMTEEENMTDSTAMQTDSAAMTETQPVTK
ncbi:MAG TPA: hypothetical protein PK891_01715 [Bacteroidales bacterium]|jgi:hypothetical protein|nr:hypothetical protein [Bacteroidales bacterium]HOH93327.1 hypothetical protein [Bacteroidales bacterium]HOY90413.1 hypothetical protein [Bacteroidales bacterium]